jgi:hypothetical protein
VLLLLSPQLWSNATAMAELQQATQLGKRVLQVSE